MCLSAATGAPGVLLLLEECLAIAAHKIRVDERTTLLELCLHACQQPKVNLPGTTPSSLFLLFPLYQLDWEQLSFLLVNLRSAPVSR